MVALNKSVIDDIIKNWFPIVGVLFVVAGMSYLFYEGVWQNLSESGRLTLGFLTGVALISGSYALEKKSKIIADAILGGGLLMLYLTLIFGSRFQTENVPGLIPEAWALIIATLFTIGVAFFSYRRQSQYILLVGISGGYLTPFFIGETGSFEKFMDDKGVFHYDLPLPAFLIYFIAINIAILMVSNRLFLRGIGLLNSLGLFIGTLSLSFFMGGEFPDNANNIAAFMILVVALHIGSMCVNAKKFHKETDPYLIIGYLLPLAWFVLSMNSFLNKYTDGMVLAGLLLACSAIYFGGWHYLRKMLNQDKHIALYLGGIISVVLALTKLHPLLNHFDGPALAIVAFIFGCIHLLRRPLIEREISFYIFALFGTILAVWHINEVTLPDLGVFRGTTLILVFCLLPFLLSYFFPKYVVDWRSDPNSENEYIVDLRISSYFAAVFILLLLFWDIMHIQGIPPSFLFLTLPAAITCLFTYKASRDSSKLILIKTSLVLAAMGFFTTFVVIINRFYSFPLNVKLFATAQSLVGFTTLGVFALLSLNINKLKRVDIELYDDKFDTIWQFILTLFLYVSLWSTITHEILAIFNTLDFHVEGIKSFSTTIWWSCLGAYMIFIGVNNSALVNQKNIGFGLLSLTIFKILLIDLHNLNTNFKVFVFMLVGILMLYISYVANKKADVNEV
ncbi:MAG: DUF2339 domain-containing protein [Methylococcales bacterium]|nr:DUF2339 domain-containing protein [Methylococcales bacterium]